MKFNVYADIDYVTGHLRYGHLEGTVECESVEKLKELFTEEDFKDCLELVVDDYEVEDYGDIDSYSYSPIDEAPEYVSLGAYEQAMWERDTAIDQLHSYGVEFGEKAEMQRVIHGKWSEVPNRVLINGKIVIRGTAWGCSACNTSSKQYLSTMKYCPNCGCKMDGE